MKNYTMLIAALVFSVAAAIFFFAEPNTPGAMFLALAAMFLALTVYRIRKNGGSGPVR